MAFIGLAHIVGARCNDAADVPTYTEGFRYGRAVKAVIDPKYEDVSDYGDINDDEEVQVFAYADVTLEVSEEAEKAESLFYGHTADGNSVVSEELDQAGPVGLGFRVKEKTAGKERYIAIWLYKVNLTEEGQELETRADSIKYGTVQTKGKAVPAGNGQWRKKATFTTKQEADSWLDEMAGITQEGD